MATAERNLSDLNKKSIPDAADYKIGIVVSDWNDDITNRLLEGAQKTLMKFGVKVKNMLVHHVPGAFELSLGAQFLFEYSDVDGIIAIGTVIQGETKHFDFVCQGTTIGIKDVNLKYNKPVSFCVLTDENKEQSKDRSGGKYGNKGDECALACLKMIQLKNQLSR